MRVGARRFWGGGTRGVVLNFSGAASASDPVESADSQVDAEPTAATGPAKGVITKPILKFSGLSSLCFPCPAFVFQVQPSDPSSDPKP